MGYLPHDPTSGVKQFREAKKMPNPFRDDEIEALKRQLSPKHRNILTVYLETGLRRGELTGLEWMDVSFEGNGSITVRDPKNDEDREIPLSQSVRKVLQERKAGPVISGALVLKAAKCPFTVAWLRRVLQISLLRTFLM